MISGGQGWKVKEGCLYNRTLAPMGRTAVGTRKWTGGFQPAGGRHALKSFTVVCP